MTELSDLVTQGELEYWKEEIFHIKQRQREYEMHDDWCPMRKDQVHQKNTDLHLNIRPCDCWLVRED